MDAPQGNRYLKPTQLLSIDTPQDLHLEAHRPTSPNNYDDSDRYFQSKPHHQAQPSSLTSMNQTALKSPTLHTTDYIDDTQQNLFVHQTSSSSLKGGTPKNTIHNTDQNTSQIFVQPDNPPRLFPSKSKRIMTSDMRSRLKNKNNIETSAQKTATSTSEPPHEETPGSDTKPQKKPTSSHQLSLQGSTFRKNSKHNSSGVQINPDHFEHLPIPSKRAISSTQHIGSTLSDPADQMRNLTLKVPGSSIHATSTAITSITQNYHQNRSQHHLILTNPATAVSTAVNSPKRSSHHSLLLTTSSSSISTSIITSLRRFCTCFFKKPSSNRASPSNRSIPMISSPPQQPTLNTITNNPPSQIHGAGASTFFQLAGQLIHNQQMTAMGQSIATHPTPPLIPTSALTSTPMNTVAVASIPEINPGTNWNFVKKLAKVKKFIDSIKTSSLYQSFYKINTTHLALIADKSDFTIIKEPFQKQRKRQQLQRAVSEDLQYFTTTASNQESTSFSLSWIDENLPLFLPHQPLLNWFKVIMFIITMINLVLAPLIGSFQIEMKDTSPLFEIFFILPFIFFILEILISCNTAYYEEGDIQMSRKRILKQYAKSQLIIDLISTLALYMIFGQSNYLFIFFFMLRILKISYYRREINEYFYIQQRSNTAYTLVNLIATVVFVAHYFACGFNYVAFVEETTYSTDSWVVTLSIDPNDSLSRYINSIYFSFITMVTVGFGDIKPTTDSEKVYVTLVALISSLIFAYTVNTIGTVFQEIAQQEAEYKAQKYHLSVYMRSRGINQQLQTRVMKYLDHMIHKELESPQKGQEILSKMSKKLSDEIYKDFFGNILFESKMFKFNYSEPFLKDLTLIMKEIICRPGEIIFSANEVDNRIFFINKGYVELFLEKHKKKDEQDNYSYDILSKGDIFGELSFFTSKVRETGAKSLSISHLIYCSYEDFIVVLKDYPKDYEKFCQMKDEVMNYGEQLNTRCAVCQKFRHSIVDCPYIHMNMRRENVIHRHVRSIPNERSSDHNRKKEVKSNTLTHQLKTRMFVRKVRKDYVQQCKKQQNIDEDMLIEDTKAGYHINLKRHNDSGDVSSTNGSQTEIMEEIKKISDRKFYKTTPKLYCVDNHISLHNPASKEEEEDEEQFEEEDVEFEIEDEEDEDDDDDEDDDQDEYSDDEDIDEEDEDDNDEDECDDEEDSEQDDNEKQVLHEESYSENYRLKDDSVNDYNTDDDVNSQAEYPTRKRSDIPKESLFLRQQSSSWKKQQPLSSFSQKGDGAVQISQSKKLSLALKARNEQSHSSTKPFGLKKSVTLKTDGPIGSLKSYMNKKRFSLGMQSDVSKVIASTAPIIQAAAADETPHSSKSFKRLNSISRQVVIKPVEKLSPLQVNFRQDVRVGKAAARKTSKKLSRNKQKEALIIKQDTILESEQRGRKPFVNDLSLDKSLPMNNSQSPRINQNDYSNAENVVNQRAAKDDMMNGYKDQNRLVFKGSVFSLKIAGISQSQKLVNQARKQSEDDFSIVGDANQRLPSASSNSSSLEKKNLSETPDMTTSFPSPMALTPNSPRNIRRQHERANTAQKLESLRIVEISETKESSMYSSPRNSRSPRNHYTIAVVQTPKNNSPSKFFPKSSKQQDTNSSLTPRNNSHQSMPIASEGEMDQSQAKKKSEKKIRNLTQAIFQKDAIPNSSPQIATHQGQNILRLPTLKLDENQSKQISDQELRDNMKLSIPLKHKNTKNQDSNNNSNNSNLNSALVDPSIFKHSHNQFLSIPSSNINTHKGTFPQVASFNSNGYSGGTSNPIPTYPRPSVTQYPYSDFNSAWKSFSQQQQISQSQQAIAQLPLISQHSSAQSSQSQQQQLIQIPPPILTHQPIHSNTLGLNHQQTNSYKKQQTMGKSDQIPSQNIAMPLASGTTVSSLSNVALPSSLTQQQLLPIQQYLSQLYPKLPSIFLQNPGGDMHKLIEEHHQAQLMHEQSQQLQQQEFSMQQDYLKKHFLFLYDFDKAKEYTNYFPHNNYSIVCKEKKKIVNRKLIFSKKIMGNSSRNLIPKLLQQYPPTTMVSPRGTTPNPLASSQNLFSMGASFRGNQIAPTMLGSSRLLVSPTTTSPKNQSVHQGSAKTAIKHIQQTSNSKLKKVTESLLSKRKNSKLSLRASQVLPAQQTSQPLDVSSSPTGSISKSGGPFNFNPTQNSMILKSTDDHDIKNSEPSKQINPFTQRLSSIELQASIVNQSATKKLSEKSDYPLEDKNQESSILIDGKMRETFLSNNP